MRLKHRRCGWGCGLPWVTQFPAWERERPWEEVFIEAMAKPSCANPIWSAETPEANLAHTLSVMQRRNIIGVVSGPVELLRPWTAAAPERVIPSLQFRIGRDDVSPEDLRRLHAAGEIAVFGEIANQYGGIAPNDPRMDPYWAVAEELDIPVQIQVDEMIAVMTSHPQVYMDIGGLRTPPPST